MWIDQRTRFLIYNIKIHSIIAHEKEGNEWRRKSIYQSNIRLVIIVIIYKFLFCFYKDWDVWYNEITVNEWINEWKDQKIKVEIYFIQLYNFFESENIFQEYTTHWISSLVVVFFQW